MIIESFTITCRLTQIIAAAFLFAERRREAYDGDSEADQFELALIYLSRQAKIKSLNRKMTSYGLKHRAENLSRNYGLFTHLGDYVSNGMLIAAAYSAGFTVHRIRPDPYNAYLNISMQTVKASLGFERGDRHRAGSVGKRSRPVAVGRLQCEEIRSAT
ncbi:hypothetical protein [Sinorhizobium terangae]|uniref:hypothetical protein n=1 Tax=Sinorhizobium terangae TaxID=110322 RepID=UPI0024B192C4|nr:hypothetical protein [Sinorhizobium terangae]WFU51786.1 hypothetical protein QA637_30455 [Sinorhizobium terangae]